MVLCVSDFNVFGICMLCTVWEEATFIQCHIEKYF
jgi:hypothetical protein